MNHKIGDRAICQMCTEKIEFVGPHWQHTDLPPGVQPRHPAWPREPVPEYIGVDVTGCAAEPDDPKPATEAALTLEILTLTMVRTLAEAGVHPALCETAEYQVRILWRNALRTVSNAA